MAHKVRPSHRLTGRLEQVCVGQRGSPGVYNRDKPPTSVEQAVEEAVTVRYYVGMTERARNDSGKSSSEFVTLC